MAMKKKPVTGMRDILPREMEIRNYAMNLIRETYGSFGFVSLETPCVEHIENLSSKQGGDNEKLIFKILKRGEKLKIDSAKEEMDLVDGGLRYDLTVPLSRYYSNNANELPSPFKALQMGNVWRADRPQKGRYREFYQCDADIVGSDSLINEIELMQMEDAVFTSFGIRVQIKINNRKILTGIAEVIGAADKIVDITVAIDKLDKIGLEKVNEELAANGISAEAIEKLQPIITLSGSNEDKLKVIEQVLANSEIGMKGVEETRFIFNALDALKLNNEVQFDITLARGLNYYTGAIFEVKALDTPMGSISGGGRYDNLTGIFGMPGLSGVGISFGADRIYDVLNALNLYPEDTIETTRVMFVNFGEKETACCMQLASALRRNGIAVEIYPDNTKMKKQMAYANAKNIPFVAMVGENEMATSQVSLKNMVTGEQQTVAFDELESLIK